MKYKIAVVTGGNSGESVISFRSADVVIKHLEKSKYEPYKISITGSKWVMVDSNIEYPIDKNDFSCTIGNNKISFDCVFMALHGTPGEDGKLQGYFDLLNIPYTNSGLLTSALTFNKKVTTALLSKYGIKSAESIVVYKNDRISEDEILEKISLPCFVKPNEGGSSIGTSKVTKKEELKLALDNGFKEDDELIIEEFIKGTEITCGVINYQGKPTALAITEIVSKNDFFDFEAKYNDNKTEEITPARISPELEKKCKEISEYIYKVLLCKGMIRIDYIIKNNELYMLEVNTVPGLSEQSILPKQAKHFGLSLAELFGNAIRVIL